MADIGGPFHCLQEKIDIAVAFDSPKTLFGFDKSAGQPAFRLIRRGAPALHPTNPRPQVAEGILDAVGAQQTGVQCRWTIKPVQRQQVIPRLVEAVHGFAAMRRQERPQFGHLANDNYYTFWC